MAVITAIALVLLLCLPLIITASPLQSLPVDGTACDWNVWDDTVEEKSVQKISIRCSEGQVTWRTPYGGLALDFLPLLKSQRYELCLVAQSSFAALQLFLEEGQTLTRLAALNGSKLSETREICLKSDGSKPVVIFIETDSSSSSPVYGKMILEYDVQVINQSYSTHMQECGPCSDEETVMAVCTADYAVFGEIHSITKREDTGLTELNVITTRVIRQRSRIVKDLLDVQIKNSQQTFAQHFLRNRTSLQANKRHSFMKTKRSLADFGSALNAGNEPSYHLSIVVPDKCQIRRGNGVFLFLGNIRLKRARLGCAPRVEEFKRIWNDALAAESNPCIL